MAAKAPDGVGGLVGTGSVGEAVGAAVGGAKVGAGEIVPDPIA